jgi:lysozyme
MSISPQLVTLEKHFEGFKDRVYLCPSGFRTIGYGHNCDAHNDSAYYLNLEPISEDLATRILLEDLEDAKEVCAKNIRSFEHLDEVRQSVLVDMAFNMGIFKVLGFKKLFNALDFANYKDAAREIYNSKMARQTDREGPLMFMLLTGEYFYG